MSSISDKEYDVIFIGQVCYDEVIHFEGHNSISVGGAAVYGAVAAAKAGKKVAALLMLSPEDKKEIEFLKDFGLDLYTIDSPETTRVEVIHKSSNMEDRIIVTKKFAGLFEENMIPPLNAKSVHLAGCNDHEFTLDFIKSMKDRGYSISTDMQSFIRYNDPESGEIGFRDYDGKQELMKCLDKVKLDILEARILTGTDDLSKAASIVQQWGCPEMLITCSDGVLGKSKDTEYFAKFTNKGTAGRTGRGDTTFGAFLARRVDYGLADSVKFAAALVSIKMETPGPFTRSLGEVLARMD